MRTDLALDILKIVLLFLLYLFFARVLWAVWQEVRTDRRVNATPAKSTSDTQAATRPMAQPGSRGKRGRVGRLVILEPKDRRGTTFALRLDADLTIGREDNNIVKIDGDTFVSSRHARVYLVDGQAMVEDLGSTNGSFHNGNRLHGSRLLHPGDRIQIGYTVLEAQ